MSVSTNPKHTRSGRLVAWVGARRPCGVSAVPRGTDAKVPEWMTDAWKRHVEAEARCKLKDQIHHIGAGR